MHTDSTPLIGYVFLAAIILSAAGNVCLGPYLLYQFFVSRRRGRSTDHWTRLWGIGCLLFLAGLPTIFIGGAPAHLRKYRCLGLRRMALPAGDETGAGGESADTHGRRLAAASRGPIALTPGYTP